jgi:hypothetical protein
MPYGIKDTRSVDQFGNYLRMMAGNQQQTELQLREMDRAANEKLWIQQVLAGASDEMKAVDQESTKQPVVESQDPFVGPTQPGEPIPKIEGTIESKKAQSYDTSLPYYNPKRTQIQYDTFLKLVARGSKESLGAAKMIADSKMMQNANMEMMNYGLNRAKFEWQKERDVKKAKATGDIFTTDKNGNIILRSDVETGDIVQSRTSISAQLNKARENRQVIQNQLDQESPAVDPKTGIVDPDVAARRNSYQEKLNQMDDEINLSEKLLNVLNKGGLKSPKTSSPGGYFQHSK